MTEKMPEFSDYIVFVDESGSPSIKSIGDEYPIFVLVFCVFNKWHYADVVQPLIKRLKFEFFGHDMAILHSHEIRKPRGDFEFLLDAELRTNFLGRIDQIIANSEFRIMSSVIDKRALRLDAGLSSSNPYDLALNYCLHDLNAFLNAQGQSNRLTHIIAESRGKTEDRLLLREFQSSLDWFQEYLGEFRGSRFSLRFADKKINSAGLQFADLMGHPIGRHVLKPEQPNHAYELLREKLFAVPEMVP